MAAMVEKGEMAPPIERKYRSKIEWGSEEAKAAYFEFSREIDKWQQKDKQKFELGMRAAENAERCATNVAGGCFSATVGVRDIEWALKWARVSCEAAEGGVRRYTRDYFEFPKFCDRVLEWIGSQKGGFASDRDLGRAFRRNMKFGSELDKATSQLQKEGMIERSTRPSTRGPAAIGWQTLVQEV
jgi:hypothetical protein